MISELPKILLILLAVLTLLGAVIGYCISLLVTKSKVRKIIDSEQLYRTQQSVTTQSDLQSAKTNISLHRTQSAMVNPPNLARVGDTEIDATAAYHREAHKVMQPLSRELDIPTLAESEVADTMSDPELDFSTHSEGGVTTRG